MNPDWASEAFRAAAGRRIGCRTSHPVVVAALRDMALQGHRRAFLKHVVPKRGTWTVDLDGAEDVAVASERS